MNEFVPGRKQMHRFQELTLVADGLVRVGSVLGFGFHTFVFWLVRRLGLAMLRSFRFLSFCFCFVWRGFV